MIVGWDYGLPAVPMENIPPTGFDSHGVCMCVCACVCMCVCVHVCECVCCVRERVIRFCFSLSESVRECVLSRM